MKYQTTEPTFRMKKTPDERPDLLELFTEGIKKKSWVESQGINCLAEEGN